MCMRNHVVHTLAWHQNLAPCRHIPTNAMKSASTCKTTSSANRHFLPCHFSCRYPPVILCRQPYYQLHNQVPCRIVKLPSFFPLPILRRPGLLFDSSRKASSALVSFSGLRGCSIVIHLCHCLLAHCVVGVLDMPAREVSDMSVAHVWSFPRLLSLLRDLRQFGNYLVPSKALERREGQLTEVSRSDGGITKVK